MHDGKYELRFQAKALCIFLHYRQIFLGPETDMIRYQVDINGVFPPLDTIFGLKGLRRRY